MGSGLSSEDGIYDEAPLKGILVWNSHAFNVTDTPAGLDMWINFDFAAPAEQKVPLRRFVDITAIADMHVPPFGTEEICQQHVLQPGARQAARDAGAVSVQRARSTPTWRATDGRRCPEPQRAAVRAMPVKAA